LDNGGPIVLSVDSLTVSYGGLAALSGLSIDVGAGEFVAIVGPNGAGKTTLFKSISGTVQPEAGRILFEGADLLATAPALRARLGIAHVPEGRQVFRTMSVLDNLEMGAYPRNLSRLEWRRTLERIFSLFPRLAERRHQLGGTLSGGEQQMLAIGRGLASAPRLLLLDEPSMGLAPKIADTIFEAIQQVHRQDRVTVVLVEQRVVEALEACDRGYVIESGQIVLRGTKDVLLKDSRVKQAYLGLS
jgi:branched-chain amino acid transport system ATP-binding protein